MKLTSLLALPALLSSALFSHASLSAYNEHLHLLPLPQGALYAGFDFTSTTSQRDFQHQNFRYFPRSLGQILQWTHTSELHLRFSLGRWDEESWGSRPRHGRREGGTGVELWAWVEGATMEEAERRWSSLVNSLSGQFCASLNFVDETKTIRPVLSFEPEGTHADAEMAGLHLLHGTLPHEVVCTENLTPFLKLLPCKGKAGISSLLDGHKLFDASWQTMAVDVRPIRELDGESALEIQQTVDMVLDIERSMRPRDNPIPRPPPIEDIRCDESKPYNAGDTCYPLAKTSEMAWSLSKIFGRSIRGACPLSAEAANEDLSLCVSHERAVTVERITTDRQSEDGSVRYYSLPVDQDVDITLPEQTVETKPSLSQPPLLASRQMTGHGQERGGMHATLTNPHPYPQTLIYLESLPWFLKPYIHTLKVTGGAIDKMYYKPALDRKRGTHLELLLSIPAFTTLELTYEFEKAILRYTEYPPDANRGFDVAPAIIRVLATSERSESYLRTTSLLLPLPTPDFSMPYNVIILTSTVIAMGFGSIFNLLVRAFVASDEVPASPLGQLLVRLRERVQGTLAAIRTRKTSVKGVNGILKEYESLKANGDAKKKGKDL